MKLKTFFCSLLFVIIASNAWAADTGLRYISNRGKVRCGTDLSAKTYAYQDKDKYWRGIDTDICRMFSMAIFGNAEHFQMMHINSRDISKALATDKIDIMLGNSALSASYEIAGKANVVDVLYYDKQMFLAKPIANATSMLDYKGAKVCTVSASEDLANVQDYDRKYALELKPIAFGTSEEARNAFLMGRCPLYGANEIYLKGVRDNFIKPDVPMEILPEVISYRPIYAYVYKDNNKLRLIAKWILNAVVLAEAQGINSKNVEVFIGLTESSTSNLLGGNPKIWKSFGLQPDWVKKYLADYGNYGEVYERNLGADSSLKIERDKNNIIENGGLIKSQPFL